MLLTLPTELIQLILRSCEPSSFLQLAFCNRRVFEIASTSRDLCLYQLSLTPGRTEDVGHLPAEGLWNLLKKRAYQELCGAEFLGDRKLFTFRNPVIDTRASTLNAAGTRNQAVLAFKGLGTIYLCNIQDGDLSLQQRLESPGRRFGAVEVLHTAVGSQGVYMLHRLRPFIDQDLNTNHPFVKHALQANINGSIFLACYPLDSTTPKVQLFGFQDQRDYEPLALAVHDNKFAISWQHTRLSDDHLVMLYTTREARDIESSYDEPVDDKNWQIDCKSYDSLVLTEVNDNGFSDGKLEGKGPTTKLAFNDRGLQVLHHYRARTLYGTFQRLYLHPSTGQSQPGVSENTCNVSFSESLSLQFSIGIPFFGTHQGNAGPHGIFCQWKYLALGIATHRVEHWTVACLLKSEARCLSQRCGHVLNLERGRRYDNWNIMAQLGGFQESSTSYGSLIATSALGTRIAIASWRTISIWAIHPQELIEDKGYEFYPESWQSPQGLTELRPIVIQLHAVCSQLQFAETEDELIAITDRGILTINLRPDGSGVQVMVSPGGWFADEQA